MKNPLVSRSFTCAACLVSAFSITTPALAFGDHDRLSEQATQGLREPGSVGLGYSLKMEASPYQDVKVNADLLPLFSYEGERLFLHSSRIGLKVLDTDVQRLDLFIDKRLEGFPLRSVPSSLSGMATRQSSTDAGLAYRYRQPWGTVRAEVLQGLSTDQKGFEARLGISQLLHSGRWTLTPDASLSYRSAKLNDYYYGVRAAEATPGRPAYAAGAGLNASVALHASYQASQHWRLLGGATATLLSSAIHDSPVVSKRVLPAVYVGAAYDFGAPQKASADAGTPTYIKVLDGASTADGCHLVKILTARCFSTSASDRTNIQGIQIGKPFVQHFNGWPLDLVGYVGLTRHDERGLQPNGLQADMLMKGYFYGFPWQDKVKTRLGMGVGLSLAQRVPYVEADKAATSGNPSSRLLHYLDPTADVSVGDVIGVRTLKDTYLGVGVAHRSGIFGSSRLLGNVNGGSNYIYTYLESAF
jgi:MipA family protein